LIVIVIYFILGLVEYIRLSDEFREKLRADFPCHSHQLIEVSLIIVLILLGFPLLIMKTFLNIKVFFSNIWKKITFPFRIRKFAKNLNKVAEEKNNKKSVEMLFDAMKEVMK
jgi:hypothetical protein